MESRYILCSNGTMMRNDRWYRVTFYRDRTKGFGSLEAKHLAEASLGYVEMIYGVSILEEQSRYYEGRSYRPILKITM